jgi:UrcA family protein
MTRSVASADRLAACAAFGSIGVALAGGAAAQAPAHSATSDGVTVYGRQLLPGEPYSLSERVNIRDLDLATRAGVNEARFRIASTANALCSALGERPEREQNTTVLPSCQGAARQGATGQVMRAVDAARYRASYYGYR